MADEIRKILDEYKDETKKHFDVVAEDLKDDIKTVSEQVGTNTEKIDALTEQVVSNSEDITTLKTDVHQIKDDVEVIKLDIEFIKNELKQKVSHDEFAALEKRVSMMEIKLNKIS